MTKTDSYFVNLGHAIIDYLLKLIGGKALREKIGHVTYVIKMRLVMNSIMQFFPLNSFKSLLSNIWKLTYIFPPSKSRLDST
jgi:hypothetical protein